MRVDIAMLKALRMAAKSGTNAQGIREWSDVPLTARHTTRAYAFVRGFNNSVNSTALHTAAYFTSIPPTSQC